jgi:hypothetical protein
MPARLRMASSSAYLTDVETITQIEMLTFAKEALKRRMKWMIIDVYLTKGEGNARKQTT